MKYGKLINGLIRFMRFPIGENEDIFTNDETIIRQCGYKSIIFEEQPALAENEYVTPIYTETETEIVVTWEVHVSDDATEEDYINALSDLGVDTNEEENT